MRKLALDLDSILVESYDATPRLLRPSKGTVDAHAADAVRVPQTAYLTCGGCVPYTQNLAMAECCELSLYCPTYDINCPVKEETHVDGV